MGADRPSPQTRRGAAKARAAQFEAVFETKLWPLLADAGVTHKGGALCFDSLRVGTDERDGLNGFTHATDGLVLTSDADATTAPRDSQIRRSADALKDLRRVLIDAFAPPAARATRDRPARSTMRRASAWGGLAVTLGRSSSTAAARGSRDTEAVAGAVLRGCNAATDAPCPSGHRPRGPDLRGPDRPPRAALVGVGAGPAAALPPA